MDYREVAVAREFRGRPEPGADWREEVAELAREAGVRAGWVTGFGAVENAELEFFDQDERETRSVEFHEPLTVVTCQGTVSRAGTDARAGQTETSDAETGETEAGDAETDGPAVDCYAVLARASGQALAGKLHRATVYDGEVTVRAYDLDLADRPEWL